MPSPAMTPPPDRGFLAAWDRFFFTPADPAPLGLIRIATGVLLLWSLGCLGLDLRAFLGSDGWVDQSILREIRESGAPWEWSLWNLVPDHLLWPAWGAAMIVLGLFTAGFASRITAPLAWAIAISTARRNPIILFGFDGVISLWAFYLAVTGTSGLAFSVDRWLARKRGGPDEPTPSVAANVAIRLIQVHLAIIYGAAGIAKLRGASWTNGSALITILGNVEFRPFDLTSLLALPGALYFLNAATHLAMWTEVLYPVLIWRPALRPWMLGAAVAMHAGIALTLGLTEFSLAMLAGNLAFISGDGLRARLRPRHGMRRGSGVQSTTERAPAPLASKRPEAPPGRSRR